MMLRSIAALAAFFLLSFAAQAQQSLFESGDGKSSLYMRESTAGINLGDSKASVTYLTDRPTQGWSGGIGAYATSNSGITALFSSDKPKAPEGGVDATLAQSWSHNPVGCPPGYTHCSIFLKEHSLILDAGYGRSSFYIYPAGSTPSASMPKTDFNRFRGIAAYNFYYGGTVILGIAGGAERRNNLTDLKSVSLNTVVVTAPAGGQSSVVSTQAGYYGNYKAYTAAPLYGDCLYFFHPRNKNVEALLSKLFFGNRLAGDLFAQGDLAPANRGGLGGIGLFLMDKKDGLKTLGGVTLSYDGTKLQLSLTTGFTSSSKSASSSKPASSP